MTKRFGFTLAEVLITLGIIGVVAAMTMYKKALSALSQAVTLNVALDEWSFADLDSDADGSYGLLTMLQSRMNVVRTETGTFEDTKGAEYKAKYSSAGKGQGVQGDQSIGGTNVTLFFNDGIMFTFDPAQATACTQADGADAKKCYGFIDVNGIKAPNRIVQCDGGNGTDDDCDIKSPTDIYPVVFYDQTVLPNSVAARAVLYSK